MATQNVQFLKWNHGLISRYALARIDLEHLRYAAEKMINWIPRVFGTMMLRPGMGYITSTHGNQQVKTIPFVRSSNDTAIVELRNNAMRVLVNEQAVVRPAVSTTITNEDFTTDLTGWTQADEAGGLSYWETQQMKLLGNGFNAGIRYQTVTLGGGNSGVEHALRIHVFIGPVVLRVGSTVGGDEYVTETTLGCGTHSIAFVPTGNFTIQFSNRQPWRVIVDYCELEAAGEMALTTPWSVADFPNLRWDQSADVLYVCDGTNQQCKIEHRSDRSWSVVKYEPLDGPFRTINISRITLRPTTLDNAAHIIASAPLFKDGHVGALFRLISGGQHVSQSPAGDNQFTDAIEVTGVGSSRIFTIDISGTWASTIHLQRSLGAPGAWVNVQTFANGTHVFNDKLDNQIAYYRVGFANGDYTSGAANVDLIFGGGSTIGTARIWSIVSTTEALVTIYEPFGSLDATSLWYEGAWSDFRGWPSAVQLFEGRLWWMGGDKFFGSVSDAYEGFDDQTVGDSGPIQRSIGQGPVDTINWAAGIQRLVAGTAGTEISARSSSIDEPLTPTNFNLKYPTNMGSARVAAVKIDASAVFVQRSGQRIYRMAQDSSSASYVSFDYSSADLTALVPELCAPGVAQLAVQRQPDTRLHVRRTDGTVCILVFDALEQVKCWIELQLSGTCEDICILPNAPEDLVYYVINRTINGATVRYYEKWALETDCVGDTVNKQADSFVTYSGAATNVLAAAHLKGQQVIVWADGRDLSPLSGASQKTYTVNAITGNVTLDAGVTVSNAVIGLPYRAAFKGVKLAYAGTGGTALNQGKRVVDVSMVLADTHYQGLEYGQSLIDDDLDNLPQVVDGVVTDADTVWNHYDDDNFTFAGEWNTDSRVCLRATAPRPCRVMALVVGLHTQD